MVYNRQCEICKKKYTSIQPFGKFCSNPCRQEAAKVRVGRYSDRTIPGGTVGAISELMVSADLMKRGYAVFRALSPACYCDIIAVKEDKTLMVEVRTGYVGSSGRYTFPTLLHGKTNIFGIYIRLQNKVVYIDIDKKTQVFL